MRFVSYLVNEVSYLCNTDIGSVVKRIRNKFGKVEESKCPRDPRPLITFDKHIDYFNPYDAYFTELNMVLVSKDSEIISMPTQCRDYLNDVIRHQITNASTGSSYAVAGTLGRMDRDSLRIGLLLDQPYNNRIKVHDGLMNGIRVANMYGRVAGWRPFMLIHCRIEQSQRQEPSDFYVMVGDRNWQRTPQYISMLFLIIRLCLRWEVPLWVEDAYSMQAYWHELIFHSTPRQTTPDVDDFLRNSYGSFLTLLAHGKEIFPYGMGEGYSVDIDNFHSRSGMNSLIAGNSTHPDSTKKLVQLRRYDSGKAKQENNNRH